MIRLYHGTNFLFDKPKKLTIQYSFHSERALSKLVFKEAKRV